ncbi:MAG TPA: hypothetical protein VM286_01160, partial [Candidatus Thermoplasmatota archaeon]|nr:hypothetical protein [Candidatus Thermoplasmatota archaeon]
NVFCAQANTITVTLAPLGDSGIAGLTGTLPASVSVPLPPNVVPGGSFNQNVKGNATAVLEIAVVSTTMADHDHSFVVKASTAAGFPGDCKGINPTGPAAASAEKPVAVRTGPALASTTSGTASGGASGCSGASCTATQKSFFLPMQVQVLVLLAVGLLGRRRA